MQKLQLSKIVRQADRSGHHNPFQTNRKMVAQIYDSINRAIFGGMLKRPQLIINAYTDMWGECQGARRKHCAGPHYTKCIRITRNWPNMKKLINVIAHEMIHQWEWERKGYMSHGANFWGWQDRLANRGLKLYSVM